MARTRHSNDYGTEVGRSNRLLRPSILANHVLHWISSVIVMSIAAYFIANYPHNVHLRYWVAIAAIDVVLYIPALALPAIKSYKGYLAPLALIFSYLWLTAFIFASQDYSDGRCFFNSPSFVNQCNLKRTLQAFSFIAFFTNLVGLFLETRLWDNQRFKGGRTFDTDKHHTGTSTVGPSGPTGVTGPTVHTGTTGPTPTGPTHTPVV